jgi:tRNA 2-thiocytidine biosynthesis protein TtcA
MHMLTEIPLTRIPIRPMPVHEAAADKDDAHQARKLERRLLRQMGQAITDFGLIESGDKVMVCLSGGKDSHSLLDLLLRWRKLHGTPDFDLVAVNLDQKQPGFPAHVLPEYLTQRGIPFHIETRDTYSVVKQQLVEGQTQCSLCSRLRRGILHRVATELGCNKLALGHHRDDMLHTFLLNFFFAGKLQAMPPKGVSKGGAQAGKDQHTVIRPLAYVAEADLVRWAEMQQFPIIPCTLCGSQDNLQRQQMKELVAEWQAEHPSRIASMFTALKHVMPSHLLDTRAFDFKQMTGADLPVVVLD